MPDDLAALVEAVAAATVEMDVEHADWKKASVVNGLLATGYVDEARALVDRAVETQTSDGQLSYGGFVYATGPTGAGIPWVEQYLVDRGGFDVGYSNSAALGDGVLEFYERTGDERYLAAAEKQYAFLQSVERTADGAIPQLLHPTELWVDMVYMLCPFLVRYGTVVDDPEPVQAAVDQIRVVSAHLQDDRTGLFRHVWRETPNSYPQGTFWSRGNGWAAAGLVDTLDRLPVDHPGYPAMRERFEALVDPLVEHQDASGFWHNVLDDPTAVLETSGTLQFVYALKRAMDLGLLDDDRYERAARRAMAVCEGVVDDAGRVRGVVVPPGGPDGRIGVTAFGQGWFLLAACAFA